MARKKVQEKEQNTKKPNQIFPLIGHSKQIEFLKQAHARGKMAHAYLITGPEHVGKERVALEFIAALLQKDAARLITGIDFTVIERAADEKKKRHGFSISVDQIKALRNTLTRQSLVAPYTVVLIREAETMNRSAANALLKTLEEPIPRTCLILLASHEEQMLATICSRCQTIRLSTVAVEDMEKALVTQGIAENESRGATQMSRGLPGIAINLAHDALAREWQTEEVERFFKIISGNLHDKFQAISSFVGSKRSADHTDARETVHNVLTVWEVLARDAVFARYGLSDRVVYRDQEKRLKDIGERVGAQRLGMLMEEIEIAHESLDQNLNGRLLLEHLLLRINEYETTS
ncbi:MAG: hypothetical protein HY981_02020 [Candidatus Magasanikbacteria bacterium]|nr:hypothetical protein [Candidatus Magasanikbacteria bacterium]